MAGKEKLGADYNYGADAICDSKPWIYLCYRRDGKNTRTGMTTSIWFNHNGKKYFAKMACQNGKAKVLEAKTEEGQQIDPEYIQPIAVKAHKRINSWGEIAKGDEQNEV